MRVARCLLTDKAGGAEIVHYLPFSVYEIWKFMMEQSDRVDVVDVVISDWVDREGYSFIKGRLGRHELETVVEIGFASTGEWEDDPSPTMRYYPSARFDKLKEFLQNKGLDKLVLDPAEITMGHFVLSSEPAAP